MGRNRTSHEARTAIRRLVDTYFALIDEMTAELERRRMID
jgi:hypothetical protein